MSNLAMKLDTLSYAKKLIAAGCEPKLAEAHASLQQETWIEVSEDYLSQFATHQDILSVKQDLEAHRTSTKQDLDAHRIATKHDIEELRIATKHDIEDLRITTKQEFAMIRKEMNILFYRTVISLGTLSVVVGGACITILKFIL